MTHLIEPFVEQLDRVGPRVGFVARRLGVLCTGLVSCVDGIAAGAFVTAETGRWCHAVDVAEFDVPAATARETKEV
jgi:hypothetical protein